MAILVGRDAELAELRQLLDGAARGAGACAIIEGPAGIGKSRLLATLTEHASDAGLTVGLAQATVLDRVAPLNTFLAGLRSCDPPPLAADTLAELALSSANRFLIVDRIGEALEEYARARPLLLALDDVQWADEFTILLLRILIPRLATSAIGWLLARRPMPAADVLSGLFGEGARRVSLGPLPDSAVRALCTDLLGAQPDDTMLSLVRQGGGNPFLVEEFLVRLRESGRIAVTDRGAMAVPGELPADFVTAVHHRLGDLSREARLLLDAAAVVGRPFTVHEVAGLVGMTPTDLLGVTEEVLDRGIVVYRGEELSFRHELLREAVYHRLPLPVRQALHREAASVLRAEGRPTVEIATHLGHSARKGDRQAVAVLREAAREVAATAPGAAADLVLRILDLVDPDEPDRPELLAEAIRLLALAGRVEEAVDLGEKALREQLRPTAVLLGLAEALKHAGKHNAVVEHTAKALAEPELDTGSAADLQAIRAHAMLQTGDIDGADQAGRRAIELGGAAGAQGAVVSGIEARTVVLRSRGELGEAVAAAREGVRIAEFERGDARHRHPALWLGRALVTVDEFTEAEAILRTGRGQAENLGSAWSMPLWQLYLADLLNGAGRLDDAVAEAEAGLRVADELSARATAPSQLAVLADIAVRRDDLAGAASRLERAERLVFGDLGLAALDFHWSKALLAEARGEIQAARAALSPVLGALPGHLVLLAQNPGSAPHMVRIALAAGDKAAAGVIARASAELARRNPDVASVAGAAAHADGLVRHNIGALREAVSAYAASPRPLAVASAGEDLARFEQALGHRGQAVELLDAALRGYQGCGASREAARVRRRLRTLGVRRRTSSPGAGGWGSLTESELRVIRLVAEGMTNRAVAQRLFLSPHTVDSHLRHSFTKLGVSSRVELTRQVLAQDTQNRENA
jgi:DNA-binding CsgD family transcriptional regulator/tetratricopeptide (TPR) repeat protein